MKPKRMRTALSGLLCASMLLTGAAAAHAEEEVLDLVINYRVDDEGGNRIALTDSISLPKGSDYTIEAPEIDGYVLADGYNVVTDNISDDDTVDIVYTLADSQNAEFMLGIDFNLITTPITPTPEKPTPGCNILVVPEQKEERENPFDNLKDLINGLEQALSDMKQ